MYAVLSFLISLSAQAIAQRRPIERQVPGDGDA